MKKDDSILLREKIYSISKNIVREKFPEELEFFDSVWKVMQYLISKWKELSPDKWPIHESQERLMSGLGFSDPVEMPDITAPIIIGVLSATFWHIGTLREEPEPEEIGRMIGDYSRKFGASEKVKKILKEFLPSSSLVSLIKKEIIREREKIVKERAHARAWTLRTDDPKSGDELPKEGYDKIWARRKKIPLLIIKTNGFKNIYVRGHEKDLTSLHYDLLEYVLKHKGSGGDVLNLLENVWKSGSLAQDYRKELGEAKENGTEKTVKLYIYSKTGHIRKAITILNRFLNENCKVQIKSFKKGQYKLSRRLEYYLIEMI